MNIFRYFKFIIVFGVSIIIFACQEQSSQSLSEEKKSKEESIEIEPLNVPAVNQSQINLEKITFLKKVGEIKEGFCEEEYNFFDKITGLCIDADNNLYVADSGLHKIFKFNNQGKYITLFGSQGQGPGEFLGNLRMSIGNDGKLYITDDGNWRLIIFSKNGKFINQFSLTRYIYDIPLANSREEIYLLSPSGLKIIDIFDSSFKYRQSLLEMSYQLDFPYQSPPKSMLNRMTMRPWMMEVKKLLTKEDHLFVIFNNSQIVVHFDENHKIIKQFRIDHPRFVRDYKIRLKHAISNGGWVNCFGSVFFDNNEYLYLCYYNSILNRPEIYRYQKNGKFVDTLTIRNIKTRSNQIINVSDNLGNFYGMNDDSNKIIIYQIK
ncbi:MAG: 6-bladed beta-propeller [Candidatus Aminicenantia bacterium]